VWGKRMVKLRTKDVPVLSLFIAKPFPQNRR
jgi:hypothetical protein